jgi:hypothetical protein
VNGGVSRIRDVFVETIGALGEGKSAVGCVEEHGGGDGGVHGDAAMAADVSEGKDVANGRGVEPCRKRDTWEAGEESGLGGGEGATLGGENESRGCRLNVGEERGGTDDAVCGEGVEVEVGR